QDFTQHQLFALLALKTFFKADYRGVIQLLADFAELRDELGLDKVPHYATLCYAAKRLLKKGRPSCSSSGPPRANQSGLIGGKPRAAVDATGLEGRHPSRYSFKRSGRRHSSRLWARLTVACDTKSHFLAGATVRLGPANGAPRFRPAMAQAALAVK